jgi:membrane protease YdiL (CAAX protease family)
MKSEIKGWQRILLIILPYFFIIGTLQYIGSKVAGFDITDQNFTLSSFQDLIMNVFDCVGTFLVLWIFMKLVDKEHFLELGFYTKNRLNEFILGIAAGLIIMVLAYGILIYSGQIYFTKLNFNLEEIIISILVFTIVAFVEESLFRGYILKNLMLSVNKYIAIIISSVLFSLIHYFNPNVDLFSLFELFLAGVVFGLAYLYTRNLWFPIALHLSWNLFQTFVGFNVSGQDFYSIIEFKYNQENLWNGGAFGFEGSYLAIIAELLLVILIVKYYDVRKQLHWVAEEKNVSV